MTKFKVSKKERDERRAAKRDERIKAMFPDEPPNDIDEFRNMLARKITMFVGERRKSWRGCPERVCRRQRACLAPHLHCSNRPPQPPSTPEQMARVMAQVQRALRQAAAQNDEAE